MEEEILQKIKLRPGVPDNELLLKDMIHDCVLEIKDAINYNVDEALPESLYGVVKELVLEKINMDGAQGIQSESHTFGGSTTYLDDIPKSVKRQIYRYRRLKRRC